MPAYMPARKRQDIRDAIQAGMTGTDIMQLMTVSAGTVVRIKREMGLPIRKQKTRIRGPVESVARVVLETDMTALARQALARIRAEAPTAPPAPTAPLPPEAYVGAFESRVLEFHQLLKQKDAALEHLEWLHAQELREKDAKYAQLERECVRLRDEYAQIVFQQQAWTGPTSTITQSLGNGG